MSELSLDVIGWIGSGSGDPEGLTTGSLRITAGESQQICVTDVEDRIDQTVRQHINVPLVSLTEWLLVNWWRLRWEARREKPTTAWRMAHCLAAISGGDAWPPLEISSDGEFVQLRMAAESPASLAAVRYLQRVDIDVPARDFELAVDRLVEVVEGQLRSLSPAYRTLIELRSELDEERKRPSLARMCRWQALAGFDPGEAPETWLERAQSLVERVGSAGGDEIMSALPHPDALRDAADAVDALKSSTTTVDLTWMSRATSAPARELPWQQGARLAREVRRREQLGAGPLSNKRLEDLLSVHLPLSGQLMRNAVVAGGLRNGVANGRTKVLPTSNRVETQRFFLSRMIGAAMVVDADEHLLPVTDTFTALQKLERSFAQEFLCPWAALDAFTDEHGLNDESLAEAAEQFQVSEWLVRSALVNHNKLTREHLPQG